MAEIYISELLPEEFTIRHGLLLYYNDLIVDILQIADRYNLSKVGFQLTKDNNIPSEDVDIIDWFLKNNMEEKAYEVVKPHLFFSLLKDFIFYMHESFDCSERGKVTVAYTLSRKPIKDTLFYLCWLLVDEKDFIKRLISQEPGKYDTSKISREKKKKIINRACKLVNEDSEEDLYFNLIYKGNCEYTLSSIWDQSLHLVTGNKNYPTESGNLNFIFATDEIWKDYWKMYYEKIPALMQLAVEISIALFESILKPDENVILLNKMLRDHKLSKVYINDYEDTLFKKLFGVLIVKCDECSKGYNLQGEVLTEFANDYLYTCPYCGTQERVGEYLFSEKYKNSNAGGLG